MRLACSKRTSATDGLPCGRGLYGGTEFVVDTDRGRERTPSVRVSVRSGAEGIEAEKRCAHDRRCVRRPHDELRPDRAQPGSDRVEQPSVSGGEKAAAQDDVRGLVL